MGFNALFEREDVLTILKDTLEAYYKQVCKAEIKFEYSDKYSKNSFILIPKLGMIMRSFPCKEIRTHYYKAYNIRGNIIKNVGAKILIFAATHSKKSFSMKKYLNVIPNDIINSKTIFSVCNRTLRIYDYENGKTVSIKKNTFSDTYFEKHLSFRIKHRYDFIPPIFSYGENWFEEKIIDGVMLARTTNQYDYNNAVLKSIENMKRIADDTILHIDAKKYVFDLFKKVKNSLINAKNNKLIEFYEYANKYINYLKNQFNNVSSTIPTVITHGDLQGGNILVSKDNLWIIDWETNGRRSSWFDIITIKYSTRYYGGIKKLIQNSISADIKKEILLFNDCSLEIRKIIAIFLLEDIDFYLDDINELPGLSGKVSFNNYMKEISEIDWNTFFNC